VKSRLDTIAALATAPGPGGIAIVRVSGSEARGIVERIFERHGGEGLPEARRVYVGNLRATPGGEVVDEVVAFMMQGPHSYTGDDVVEIQCHGGSLVSRRVLESVYLAGARPAEPGEFTRRAFLNGRLDLAQAEAVADLIMARSESGRRLAWSQLAGTLSSRVDTLRETLVRARALCEVSLDFPDEDLPELTNGEIVQQLASVRRELEKLIQSFERGRLQYDGARVAIVGRPNVGKSSLLNALAGSDRALVTPIAGTTRDVVEASIAIQHAPVLLMDTAGLREAEDLVEVLGVERSRSAIDVARCVVAVFDRSVELAPEDASVSKAVHDRNVVAVLTKADLDLRTTADEVRQMLGPVPVVEVSALLGSGLDDLVAEIGTALFGSSQACTDDELVIFRERHRDAARAAVTSLERAEAAVRSSAPLELVACDLTAATDALSDITGAVTTEDVLDRVFADFCLGK